jgi:serine/threonine-protein kinase
MPILLTWEQPVSMTPLHPGDRLDHYLVEEVVARGGMATIFRATNLNTGATVALKVPHPEKECDPVMFDRFRREMQIGERLDHPSIVRVLPEVRRSRPYFAAEWLDGTSLRTILDRENKLPADRALRLATAICEALRHIHENGIVHRDLKPDNVMVFADDSIKLIDFGLASLDGARRLTFGKFSRIMGTADYISPEQVEGKRGDARSDLYALGVILYEMLAGRTPWEGKNPFAVMKERTRHTPTPLRQLNSEVPEEIEAIVNRALRRDPRERFSTAAEFAEALKNPEKAAEQQSLATTSTPIPGHWWLSLAMIPATIFLLLLYVASHQ